MSEGKIHRDGVEEGRVVGFRLPDHLSRGWSHRGQFGEAIKNESVQILLVADDVRTKSTDRSDNRIGADNVNRDAAANRLFDDGANEAGAVGSSGSYAAASNSRHHDGVRRQLTDPARARNARSLFHFEQPLRSLETLTRNSLQDAHPESTPTRLADCAGRLTTHDRIVPEHPSHIQLARIEAVAG
jgi:hypothetical protein